MLLALLLEWNPKYDTQLKAVSKSAGINPDDLMAIIDGIDQNNKNTGFILKLLKTKNIILPEDGARVKDALSNFQVMQGRLANKDINKYQTLNELEDALSKIEGTGSKRSGKLQVNPKSLPGVQLVDSNGNSKLYSIVGSLGAGSGSGATSLARLGIGTKWCTRSDYTDCQANAYISHFGKMFIIVEDNKPIIQFTPDFSQVMDADNSKVPPDVFIKATHTFTNFKDLTISNPDMAYGYAKHIIKGPWPEGEETIREDADLADKYYNGQKGWLVMMLVLPSTNISDEEPFLYIVVGFEDGTEASGILYGKKIREFNNRDYEINSNSTDMDDTDLFKVLSNYNNKIDGLGLYDIRVSFTYDIVQFNK